MEYPIDPNQLISDGCTESLTKGLSDLKVGDTVAFTGPGWERGNLPPSGGFTLADIETWGCFTETAVVKEMNDFIKVLYVGNEHLLNSSLEDTGEHYAVVFDEGRNTIAVLTDGTVYFNELFIAKIVG